MECQKIMCAQHIRDKKDFLRWAKINHPDKGGSTSLFQSVYPCYDNKSFCSKQTTPKKTHKKRRRKQHLKKHTKKKKKTTPKKTHKKKEENTT
jgi:hypothetical protein